MPSCTQLYSNVIVLVSQREKEKVEAMEQEVEGARRDFVVCERLRSLDTQSITIIVNEYTTCVYVYSTL